MFTIYSAHDLKRKLNYSNLSQSGENMTTPKYGLSTTWKFTSLQYSGYTCIFNTKTIFKVLNENNKKVAVARVRLDSL